MSDSSRWTPPMRASEDFTDEQRQRVQALRAAREVVEEGTSKGAFSGVSMSANAAYLVETAEWIVNGTLPLSLREEEKPDLDDVPEPDFSVITGGDDR